ncbi:MAG TPA: flagellar biosynthesis anti-sigma factor FlgM [Candidatus Binatus sp.]|jgi:anti-sigma28 factor (negative regulator of flagellin synthesis)|nr:flagellar biosynthesis anti-sigma factor FlgM [Candidatus Binatus sp.]
MTISDVARAFVTLQAEVGDVDALRQERVNGLQAAVQSGQYQAEVSEVARKLLQEILGQILG